MSDELKINKSEKKTDKYGKNPKKVHDKKLPKSKNNTQTKIRFDKDPVPTNEAKWNLPKEQSLPVKGITTLTTAGVNKMHSKVYEAEQENVAIQAAHRAELVGESAYREGQKLTHSAYRSARNSPYRQAAKYETKSENTRERQEQKKNTQKKANKQNYDNIYKKENKTGDGIIHMDNDAPKTNQKAVKTEQKSPVMILIIILLLLIVVGFMSISPMCMSMGSMTSAIVGAVCYVADDEDIDKAELLYTELETDLRFDILNAETTHAGYDEYRYNVGGIGHDPHELMAFLTAVYHDFKYDDIESVLRDLFAGQYNLEFVPETEIRTKTETRTGTETDDDGNEVEYEYEEEVEYEWYILNVNLTSVSLMEIILPLMFSDETEHFYILMQTKGGRQYAGNPFIIDWLPYVTSYYGYRVHPITGVKDYHKGIDIGLTAGTSIYAGIDGMVTAADYDDEYGNYIVIDDGNGLEMKYAHCDTLLFSAGQTVTKGDFIATVGNTGTSTGAHLHMEIVKNGIYLNPIYFVESN